MKTLKHNNDDVSLFPLCPVNKNVAEIIIVMIATFPPHILPTTMLYQEKVI